MRSYIAQISPGSRRFLRKLDENKSSMSVIFSILAHYSFSHRCRTGEEVDYEIFFIGCNLHDLLKQSNWLRKIEHTFAK